MMKSDQDLYSKTGYDVSHELRPAMDCNCGNSPRLSGGKRPVHDQQRVRAPPTLS